MIGPFRKDINEELLNSQITSTFVAMGEHGSNEEKYELLLQKQERLHKLKRSHARRISPDTLCMVIGNVVGIVVVVAYEHAHVLTSKALSTTLKNTQPPSNMT